MARKMDEVTELAFQIDYGNLPSILSTISSRICEFERRSESTAKTVGMLLMENTDDQQMNCEID